MPQSVLNGPLGHIATTAYSYRMNTTYAPRGDYLADISRLPLFLLVVGTNEEAFVANAYHPLMAQHTVNGRYVSVVNETYLGVVDAQETTVQIRAFLGE